MTDKELLEKAIYWFRVIAEDMERITSGNLPHNAAITKGRAIRAYEFLEKHKNEEHSSEDLDKAAEDYAKENYPDEVSSGQFGTGDYEPYINMSDERERAVDDFKSGANWQKEYTINKAYKWLLNNISTYVLFDNEITDVKEWEENEFIKDFKKAMED